MSTMFAGVTTKLFNDPEFKEDSVRELILAPMLAKLGYLPTGTTRVIRSKTLKHPFIRIGTRNQPVTIIPDYTLLHEEKPIFVLDAKGPKEDVLDHAHVQQAYSYAMHPEVACREFGLCNGRQLAVFDIFHREPLLVMNFDVFESNWHEIEKYLSVRCLLDPALRRFAPDFGLALLRSGMERATTIVMLGVRLNLFGRVNDDLFTASANCCFGAMDHCASFDFAASLLPKIVAGLPRELADMFTDALGRAPFKAAAGLAIEIDIEARLGSPTRGQDEEFVPLVIEDILASRFNPEPVADDPKDIPKHIFQLRSAFAIRRGAPDA